MSFLSSRKRLSSRVELLRTCDSFHFMVHSARPTRGRNTPPYRQENEPRRSPPPKTNRRTNSVRPRQRRCRRRRRGRPRLPNSSPVLGGRGSLVKVLLRQLGLGTSWVAQRSVRQGANGRRAEFWEGRWERFRLSTWRIPHLRTKEWILRCSFFKAYSMGGTDPDHPIASKRASATICKAAD